MGSLCARPEQPVQENSELFCREDEMWNKKIVWFISVSGLILVTGFVLKLHYFFLGLNPFINSLEYPEGYTYSTPGVIEEYVKKGAGDQNLILIPDMGLTAEIFQDFMSRHDSMFTMYAITLPGFGGTTGFPLPEKGRSNMDEVWNNWVEEGIVKLIQEQNISDPVILGYGFVGGVIAQRMAIYRPDITKASFVISGTSHVFNFDRERRRAYVDDYLTKQWFPYVNRDRWNQGAVAPEFLSVDESYGEKIFQTSNDYPLPVLMQYTIERNAFDLTYHLDSLRVPIYSLSPKFPEHWREDEKKRWVKWIEDFWIKAEAGSDLVRADFIENTGFMILHDQPEIVDSILTKFVFQDLELFNYGLNPMLNSLKYPKDYEYKKDNKINEVLIEGNGGTDVILLAGNGLTNRVFDEFMQDNSDRYRMYAVTLPGYGSENGFELPGPETSNMEQVWFRRVEEGLLDLIEHHKLEEPVIISYMIDAGMIAQRMAVYHPDKISGVVLVSGITGYFRFNKARRTQHVDEFLTKEWFPNVSRERWMQGAIGKEYLSKDSLYNEQLFSQMNDHLLPIMMQYTIEANAFDLNYHMEKLKVPMYGIVPEYPDEVKRYQETAWLSMFKEYWASASAKNPLIEYTAIPNSGFLMLKDHPERINELIEKAITE